MEIKLTKMKRVKLLGKKCLITQVYRNKPDWNIVDIPERPCWITGFGIIRRGHAEDLGFNEGVVFNQIEAISVVKIRFWPTEVEHNVPVDNFVIDEDCEPYPTRSKYSTSDKKFYLENKDHFPRNKKGQFIRL